MVYFNNAYLINRFGRHCVNLQGEIITKIHVSAASFGVKLLQEYKDTCFGPYAAETCR